VRPDLLLADEDGAIQITIQAQDPNAKYFGTNRGKELMLMISFFTGGTDGSEKQY
jgi:hypothetical protein